MDTSSNLINSLNDIKASIDEKNLAQWRFEANLKCFKEATHQLKNENDKLRKDIDRMKSEMEELEPLIKMVEEMNKESIRTIKNAYESIVHHRLYKRTIESNVKEQKDKYGHILKEYQDNIDTIVQNLEISTPKYKLLKEKKIELQLSQLRCMQLKRKIGERRRIDRQKLEIRKQMFYTQIVALARAWIERRDHLVSVKKLEELSNLEREWMIKEMESTEELQKKRKMSRLNRNISMMPLQFPKDDILPKNEILDTPVEIKQKNMVEKENTFDPYSEIKNLMDQNFSQPSEPLNNEASLISTKATFNANHSKVVILENKVLKSVVPNKEERSKAIERKLQKVKNTISRNYSQRFTSQKSMLNASLNIDKSQKNMEEQKLNKNDTLANQDFNISQENPQFLSQESQKCSQPVENAQPPLSLTHNQVSNKINMKMSQNANQTLSEMKFIPQHQKSLLNAEGKDNGVAHALVDSNAVGQNRSQTFMQESQKLPGIPKPQFEQNIQMQEKPAPTANLNLFQGAAKKPTETKFMNQAGFFNTAFNNRNNTPDNILNQQKKQDNFAPFALDVPNMLFAPSDSTMRPPAIHTPFRSNEVPIAGNKDKDVMNPNQNKDKEVNKNDMNFNTNALNFGAPPQFNFGNFSQNINDSCDYAAGCLSPEYNPSPEGETQPNASFFQFSNAGTGGFGLF